jgi:dTDP-glucose 4,6-dehydratase
VKVFVTGGAGFILSNFITHVLGLSQDYSVVNFDKLTYAGNLANLDSVASNPHCIFIKGDICDPGAVEAAVSGATPSFISPLNLLWTAASTIRRP